MSGADTSLDGDLARLAAFRSRFARGVVAQLVEHHNGIAYALNPSKDDPIHSDSDEVHCLTPCPNCTRVAESVTVKDAIDRLLVAKQLAKRRASYIVSLRQYLNLFARGRETQPLDQITTEVLEKWFLTRSESPAVCKSNIGRLSALFSFGIRRGWMISNPCSRLERISVDHRPPVILSIDVVRKILTNTCRALRPWIVLCLFVGLRPSEAARIHWPCVRLASRVVVVDGAASKTRRRRIIPLEDAAAEWLSLDLRNDGPVSPPHSTLRRRRRDLCIKIGIPWHQDVLRHTYASMRIASGANVHQVADDMGNSPKMLLTHYRELVTKHEAEAFWALRPNKAEQ